MNFSHRQYRELFPDGPPAGTTIGPAPQSARRPKRRGEAVALTLAMPGVVIVEGVVLGRATPWKAPLAGGGNVKRRIQYKRYADWKRHVAASVRLCMGGRKPYQGEVAIDLKFYLEPRPCRPPDWDNATNAFQDGMNMIAFIDDTLVCRASVERIVSATEPERVEFRVTAL